MNIAENEKIYGMAECALLEDYANRLHWLKIGEDGVVEFYLDNHMLQTFRECEEQFWTYFVLGYSGKGRVWYFDLGTCVHKMVELYYILRKSQKFDLQNWGIQTAVEIWNAMNMDFYKTHPVWKSDFEKLGGLHGFCGLMVQYAQYFNLDNERIRVIGAELYFGKKKEVPILDDATKYSYAPFRLYLSGKIDLLIDNGTEIGPMDHKTKKDFKGKNPLINWEVADGMTGYVYAAQNLLKHFPDIERKPCNKIWMNFLQINVTNETKMSDRFKRYPLFKTDEQIEDYKLRQIRTVSKIYQLLINPDMSRDWDTQACVGYSTCPLQQVHRQGSKDLMFKILNSEFQKNGIWNPETIDTQESEINKLMEKEIEKCQTA